MDHVEVFARARHRKAMIDLADMHKKMLAQPSNKNSKHRDYWEETVRLARQYADDWMLEPENLRIQMLKNAKEAMDRGELP